MYRMSEEEIYDLIAALDTFYEDKDVLHQGYRVFEKKKIFPAEWLKILGDMGIMGMSFPEAYGGSDASQEAMSHVSKHLAFGWGSLQLNWTVTTTLAGFPIKTFGTEAQKKKYLPLLASGDVFGCYGLSEPDVGSDAANMKMTATHDTKKKGWYLHGKKTFITIANHARIAIIFARDPEEAKKSDKKHAGITAFILEGCKLGFTDVEGLTVTVLPKRGYRGAPFCEMDFQNVFIPEVNLLGELGNGFPIAMKTLEEGRLGIAAQAIGLARRAFYEFEIYAKDRRSFGKRIIDIPQIADAYADHKSWVEAAWEFLLNVSKKKDSGKKYAVDAAMAKYAATEAALKAVRFCSEKYAAAGYMEDEIIRDIQADTEATVIYEGSSDIMKLIIAREFQKD